MKGIVIAGTHSGCGKTTVTLALMAALKRRGLSVSPFKVGPDFIDPGHHTRIAGRESRNLDGWMLSRETNLSTFHRTVRKGEIAVVEGVMGLFDGYSGKDETGSTAEMAKWLGLPVILVVDARSMARSAAALVRGFEIFDPDLRILGVLFNRIGGERHLHLLREAMAGTTAVPCLGGLAKEPDIAIPERHLGLMTREDHPLTEADTNRLADWITAGFDFDRLLALLPDLPEIPVSPIPAPPVSVRIGVARDRAFCFYYPDNLDLLASAGAEPVFFSPLTDPRLPDGLDGLYFGGGYPELEGKRLAGNHSLREEVRAASERGMPVYGECGGFMYLSREIRDLEGKNHPMAGCFPFTARMHPRLRSLGYREVTLTRETLLGPAGTVLRGHEFHYSDLEETEAPGPAPSVYTVSDRTGARKSARGYLVNRTLGSYLHLHFGSSPGAARNFVEACRTYRKERKTLHAAP